MGKTGGRKLNLTGYLRNRCTGALALSRREAEILGIGWPMTSGWPKRYGDMEIDNTTAERLRNALKPSSGGSWPNAEVLNVWSEPDPTPPWDWRRR